MACIKETELCAEAKKYSGTVMLIYTNKFCCKKFEGSIDDVEHLLEIRIFNEEMEFKAIRPNIGKDFLWREISDINESESFYKKEYDEVQYLDKASEKTENGKLFYEFIGGGQYEMPDSGLDRAVIRHYFKYDDDGLEEYADERIVRFEPTKKGGEENA